MRIPRWLVLVAVLVPATAQADDHRADLYAGFGYANASHLWGLHEAYAWTLKDSGGLANDISILGDVSLHFGSHGGNTVTRVTYLVGPRWTIPTPEPHHKLLAHALIGGVHSNPEADTKDWAVAFGGGWEYILRPATSPKESSEGLGVRFQVDYVIRVGDNENFPRVSGGLIYRFKKIAP
jgi:hypothetical protein